MVSKKKRRRWEEVSFRKRVRGRGWVLVLAAFVLTDPTEAVLRVQSDDGQTDFFLVGLATTAAGDLHIEGPAPEDAFPTTFFHEGRVAFFLRGRIRGKYLLRMAYDSDKPMPEFNAFDVDPERFYPIYGDASLLDREASSQGRLFVRFEVQDSYLQFSDYDTGDHFKDTELTAYLRRLHGPNLHYENKQGSLSLFQAETRQVMARDEFPEIPRGLEACEPHFLARLARSGPFYLTYTPVIDFSERVWLEVRDRDHLERILETTPQKRGEDYQMDYGTGKLWFSRLIPSTDFDENPIFIIVEYEYRSPRRGDKHTVVGVRAKLTAFQDFHLGATYVEDSLPVLGKVVQFDRRRLAGLDAEWRLGKRARVVGEYARSRVNRTDKAYKIEGFYTLPGGLEVSSYYRRYGPDFTSPSQATFLNDRLIRGFRASGNVNKRLSLSFQHELEHDNLAGDLLNRDRLHLKRTTLSLEQAVSETRTVRLEWETESRISEALDPDTGDLLHPANDVARRVRLELPLDTRETALELEWERVNDRSDMGLDSHNFRSRLSGRTSLGNDFEIVPFLEIERQQLFQDQYNNQVLSDTDRQTLGWQAMQGDRFSLEARLERETGRDQQTEGFVQRRRSLWTGEARISPTLTLLLSRETVQMSGPNPSRTAATGAGLRYIPSAKLEVRVQQDYLNTLLSGTASHRRNLGLTVDFKPTATWGGQAAYLMENDGERTVADHKLKIAGILGEDWALQLDWSKNHARESFSREGLSRSSQIEMALAYRPVDRDDLHLLGKWARRSGRAVTDPPHTRRTSFGALEGVYEFQPDFILAFKYAGKQVVGTFPLDARLLVLQLQKPLAERTDVLASYRLMDHRESHQRESGYSLETGYWLHERLRVAVGYRFQDLEDLELDGNDYSGKGFFTRFTSAF